MIYREIALPDPLRAVALCAWRFVIEPSDPPSFLHQVPPDGAAGLVLTRAPEGSLHALLLGPTLAAFTVPVAQSFDYVGLRLRPEMARRVMGTPPLPGTVEQAALDGPFAPVWRDLTALIEGECAWAGAVAMFDQVEPGDAAIARAVDRLIASGGTVTVARLAALSQLSERQFRRRFHAATGIAPKQYADVQRVRRALILALDDPDWAAVAHDSGFADQPHLIRDVKQRFGAAPRRIAGYFGGMQHELLDLPDGRNIQARPANAA